MIEKKNQQRSKEFDEKQRLLEQKELEEEEWRKKIEEEQKRKEQDDFDKWKVSIGSIAIELLPSGGARKPQGLG